jgi:hypothetical protein
MYNVYLLKDMFETVELIVADARFYSALAKLVDDKVAARIHSFWERVDAMPELQSGKDTVAEQLRTSIALSKEILGEVVFKNRFPALVREGELITKLTSITPGMLRFYSDSMDELKKAVEWFVANRKYWHQYYEPRTSDDYKAFLSCVSEMEYEITRLKSMVSFEDYGLRPCDNLLKRVKDNKEFFYTPYEKRRSTGLYELLNRSMDLELIQHGIDFLQLLGVQQHPVSARERRKF